MSLSEALALAASPHTPAALLEELSQREEPELAPCLAQNPNVPTSVLYKLWLRYPQHAFANPLLPLLLLEDPNFFFEGDTQFLTARFLETQGLPESFMALVLRSANDWFLSLLANREDLPSWIVDDLAKRGSGSVQIALSRNPKTPASLVASLLEEAQVGARLLILERSGLPSALWERAASNLYPQIRAKAAERAEGQSLARLAEDIDSSVREVVAKSERITPEIAARLAQDPLRQIREGVAANANTPEDILLSLAVDREVFVRANIARRPRLSTALFALLGRDPQRAIRRLVVSREDFPEELRQQLGDERLRELREETQRRTRRRAEIQARYEAQTLEIESARLCGFATLSVSREAEDEYIKSMNELDDIS